MVFDGDAWERAHHRQRPYQAPSETLEALQERLCREHCDARHGGNGAQWNLDFGGLYCVDCLDAGYHFNLYPYDDFVRVIDGVDPDDFQEVSFLPKG